MSLNNFGRCNRSSDLSFWALVDGACWNLENRWICFFRKAQVHSSVCEKKCYERKLAKKKILPVESFLIKSIFKYLRTKDMHWYHQSLTRPRENNKIFRILKKSEDSYKLNMIWNMIEVKIAAITVRRCAKCLEFLAGKRKTRLKWLSVSKTAQ